MRSFAHTAAVSAFAFMAAAAIFILPASGLAAVTNQVMQPSSEHGGLSSVIGGPRDRALPGELQRENVSRGVMLGVTACESQCRFYGGEY